MDINPRKMSQGYFKEISNTIWPTLVDCTKIIECDMMTPELMSLRVGDILAFHNNVDVIPTEIININYYFPTAKKNCVETCIKNEGMSLLYPNDTVEFFHRKFGKKRVESTGFMAIRFEYLI